MKKNSSGANLAAVGTLSVEQTLFAYKDFIKKRILLAVDD